VLKLLLRLGAAPNEYSPIPLAANRGNVEVAPVLLEEGASVGEKVSIV
jgi:hypothetical protein